jgi:hypothetical protein
MRFNRLTGQGKFARVIALICIYGLNLVFLQGLLSESDSDSTKNFTLFTSNTNHSPEGDSNRVVDYYQSFKHSSKSERQSLVLPQHLFAHHLIIDYLVFVKQGLPFPKWLFYAYLPTESLKIYKRIRVFLI